MTIGLIVFSALLGMAVGSFLNVAISRLPRGGSVLGPPSHCPACSRKLEWWENIPVASYLALRGRCRTCHAAIGVRHLIVEAATGAVAALAAGLAMGGGGRG
jgi:leader peptidase (prepilin peptidase)/N-methyltransferase